MDYFDEIDMGEALLEFAISPRREFLGIVLNPTFCP